MIRGIFSGILVSGLLCSQMGMIPLVQAEVFPKEALGGSPISDLEELEEFQELEDSEELEALGEDALQDESLSTKYSDVSAEDWFAPYVAFALERGLMDGVGDLFLPNAPCNRGTVALALARFSGGFSDFQLEEGYQSFEDVEGTLYEEAVAWCVSHGVMVGFSDGFFGAEEVLTREQFAVCIRAYAQYKNKYFEPSHLSIDGLQAFEDAENMADWAVNDLAWAVQSGLMAGYQGHLRPKDSVSRAEVVAMLQFYSRMLGE